MLNDLRNDKIKNLNIIEKKIKIWMKIDTQKKKKVEWQYM